MSTLQSMFRPIRLAAIALALLIGLNAAPAFAFGSSPSNPTDGEASLSEVRNMSEKTLKSEPRSGKKVSSVAQDGLNGVQGAASKDKMVKPSDTDATSIKDDIESGIKSLVGQE